jgi:hypothetical protein
VKRTWWIAVSLAGLSAFAAGDELDGTITGGKAKKYVDEARPLAKEADALYRKWVLGEIPETELLPALEKMVKLYVAASDKLQKALDLQEDPGVVGQQRIICRRLVRLRAQIFYRRPKKKPPTPEPKPLPKPETEGPKPVTPKPEPERDREREPEFEPEPEPKLIPKFELNKPPGRPIDADLPSWPLPEGEPYATLAKSDQAAIKRMLKEYYQARKSNKLHFRHRLCRGNGCETCGQTGRQINLYFFRKVFWNCYAPSLRQAPGALDSLKAFHKLAHADIDALGPVITSFSIKKIDYHSYWAKVRIVEKTKRGASTRDMTLISAGGGWYFFVPDTDQELIPKVD